MKRITPMRYYYCWLRSVPRNIRIKRQPENHLQFPIFGKCESGYNIEFKDCTFYNELTKILSSFPKNCRIYLTFEQFWCYWVNLSVNLDKQCANLTNLSRGLNLPKTGLIMRRLKSWKIEYNFKLNHTIFEPRLKFKLRLKLSKFGLSFIN